jgi:predicted enzyme related to lactoylglutathione lyase
MAVQLEHVGIPASTEDLYEVAGFYQRHFGWTTVRELGDPVNIIFISDGAGGRLEVLVADGEPMAHPSHLAFAVGVDEFDALLQSMAAAGVEFDNIRENPAGDKLAFFNDPHGNRAQIVGRIEPLPQ